jgi:hypothetical protein
MIIADIASAGLFKDGGGFFHVLGMVFKLGLGGVMIMLLTVFSYIGGAIYSVYKGYEARSVLHGGRTLIHVTGYVMGAGAALSFALVAGLFFGISALKLLFVAVVLGFAVSFITRETLLFVVLQKFGKYVMALSFFEWLRELVFTNGKQETQG